MGRAAVPAYLGQDFREAPPGHRFGLYFSAWNPDWQIRDADKHKALAELTVFSSTTMAASKALRERQTALALAAGDAILSLPAQATASFTTGLGNEHPLENGFAFLNPYGIPYLPGSGVKGVLRRAAEQLALFEADPKGWDIVAVWWLFGFEPTATYLTGADRNTAIPLADEANHWREAYPGAVDAQRLAAFIKVFGPRDEHKDSDLFLQRLQTERALRERIRNRGALMCWDVLPALHGDRLQVDILNPHHSRYYRGEATPHDAESPVPVFFLTLPPGSQFEFNVQCQVSRLPECLRKDWQALVTAALDFAFDWLGFGAKTAVGYGQMVRDERALELQQRQREQMIQNAMPPEERDLLELQRWFEEDRQSGRNEAGSRLASRLNELLKIAETWPPEYRNRFVDLGEEINKFLQGSNKKKKERRARLQALRSE